jgi:hypothetical protein
MHSTTYRRQARKIGAVQAIEQRTKDAIKVGDHYTDEDRRVAEQLEAAELLREFIAHEL